MELENSFSSQFLIAMPGMADPNFNSSVTLICEHNSEGALGIIINRPLDLSLAELFGQLSIDQFDSNIGGKNIMNGGPVAPECGFVLHETGTDWESSLIISDSLALTFSRDVLDAMAAGKGPKRTLVALGYAGWEPGQLEAEMLANAWLNVTASSQIIFDAPFGERWALAARELGIDVNQLSSDAGHA